MVLQLTYSISDESIKFIKPTVEARGRENRVPLVLLRGELFFWGTWRLWTTITVTPLFWTSIFTSGNKSHRSHPKGAENQLVQKWEKIGNHPNIGNLGMVQ